MKKISIIIVTYNSLSLIKDCLDSIIQFNDIGDALDVIVVDNDSQDQSEMFDYIQKNYDREFIKTYNAGVNGGYGKGNNIGIAKTDADIVIVMNPDVRFVHPVFKHIIREFEDTKLGMAGVNFIDGSSPYYFKPEYDGFYKSLFIHQYLKRRRYNSQTMYMSGSLLIFNRDAFLEAGAFDEKIFMYYEEPDITNRILKVGKEVKWLKDLMVLHLAHGRSYNQKLIDIGYESFEYYCQKYGIDAKKKYNIRKHILSLKIIAAKIVGDKGRYDVFKNTVLSLNRHLKEL